MPESFPLAIKPGWSCWTGCVPHPSRFVPPSLASQDFWSRAWAGRAPLDMSSIKKRSGIYRDPSHLRPSLGQQRGDDTNWPSLGEVPTPIGDGVVADGAGAVDAASPAGVCGVKAFGDLLGEGPGIGPAGGVVADLGGDLARHRPHRRHLDPARRSARRGRFITPRL